MGRGMLRPYKISSAYLFIVTKVEAEDESISEPGSCG
jgi:hypothetical protein